MKENDMPLITRFWFDGDHGVVRHESVTVDLTAMPRIAGLPEHLRSIDFVPAVRVAMLRESGQAWREMELHECAVVREFLARISETVRGVLA